MATSVARTTGRTAFDRYRSELSPLVPLERSEEHELARRYAEGDAEAGARLVEACLPFVVSIALEYRRWGVPLEDIVQEGNMGLLRAAKKFDPSKETRLATYAAYWIRAEIREYVVRGYRMVRMGTTKGERKALRAFRTQPNVDIEGLAALSGLSKERVEQLWPLLSRREASLDDVSANDREPMMERLAARGPSPEEEASLSEHDARSRVVIGEALASLSEREQLIVRSRIMTEEPSTLQELGVLLGVSKERVRQLEERARAKLHGMLAGFAAEAELLQAG